MTTTFLFEGLILTDFRNGSAMVGTNRDTMTTPNAVSSANEAPEHLVIPSIAQSKSVISIGRNAFSNCKKIKTVFIPKSIRCIFMYAFEMNDSLEKMIFEEGSDVVMLEYVFNNIQNIKTIIWYPSSRCQNKPMLSDDKGFRPFVFVPETYECEKFLQKVFTIVVPKNITIKEINTVCKQCPKISLNFLFVSLISLIK